MLVRPRVWIVSDMYYPEDMSTGYYMTRIAEGLAADAEVRVLCGQPSYARRGERAPRREKRKNTLIYRVRATSFDKDRLVLRAINILTFTLSAAFNALVSLRRYDRVLCVTNPPTLPPLLALICWLRGARFVLLLHDVFPDTLAATGKLSRSSLAFRLLSAFSNLAYRLADSVVALGRDMAALAAAKRGRCQGVSVIENWADLDEIEPRPKSENEILRQAGLSNARTAQFAGNIGRTHGVETLLEAAGRLRASDWHFLIAGFGGKLSRVEAEAAVLGSNIVLLPRQPRDRLNTLLNACDVSIIGFVPGMVGLSVPSRMYNVMAAGKPIVALAEPGHELARVITEEGCGWRVEPDDAVGLATLLKSLTDADIQTKGYNARVAAEAKYSYATKIEAFRRLLVD